MSGAPGSSNALQVTFLLELKSRLWLAVSTQISACLTPGPLQVCTTTLYYSRPCSIGTRGFHPPSPRTGPTPQWDSCSLSFPLSCTFVLQDGRALNMTDPLSFRGLGSGTAGNRASARGGSTRKCSQGGRATGDDGLSVVHRVSQGRSG